ncbi:ATP-citrate synthase subunit 1 like protein [Verticillium longisporum]|nr:ATP-citrate synthase subunit 1 like protein [Verticillium longisporum]
MGVLNGLFVLGRSIGLIAHYLDQKRLRTGLYRHPWDDITYILPQLGGGAPGAEGRVEVQIAMEQWNTSPGQEGAGARGCFV